MSLIARSLLACAVVGSTAHADGALDEVSAGNVQQTATTPQSTWLSDRLAGFWDPSERWQLRGDLVETRTYTKTPAAVGLGDSSDVLLASLSLEWDPDDRFSIRAVASASPGSDSASAASFTMMQGMTKTPISSTVAQRSASQGGAVWLGYDSTAVEFPIAITASATVTEFEMRQQVTSAVGASGQMFDLQQLDQYCATGTCSRELRAALRGNESSLAQVVAETTASQTLWKNTDVGVDGAYFAYSEDPTKVGYFAAGSLGRSTSTSGAVGIAPYHWTVAPDLVRRFGGLMVMASVSYGKYVDAEGSDLTALLRVQYKLKLAEGRRLKVWAKLSGSRDVDSTNAISHATSGACGVQFVW